MKILFDHQTFSTQRYGGISRYFFNLHHGFNQMQGVKSSIATLYSENEYIKNSDVPLNNAFGRKIFTGHQNRIYRWNGRYSLLKIRKNDFDIFHPTYYDPYFIADLKKPFVLTVHDMIHELMADEFTDNNNIIAQKKLLIDKAAAIIAISEYTKSDLIKFYPGAEPKIRVIHHGYEYTGGNAAISLNLPNKYILFVGERYFYKNFIGFAEAIAPLLQQDIALQLICTGGGKFKPLEDTLFADLNITAQVQQIDATDAELHQLYKQAVVFVFPSYSEGFGFPLLEAFTAGCPVAASDNSCFPEIGGDAVAYFDPNNVNSILKAVSHILNDSTSRQAYVKKGYERLKLFSIKKCVNKTLALYKDVVSG